MPLHRAAFLHRFAAIVITAAAGLAFGVRIAHYFPFFADDSLISLRYAQRWISGQGLTWDDFQPVEGYSNFLWVVLVAAAGRLGVDLILAARCLGTVLMVGAAVPWVLLARVHPHRFDLAALLSAVGFYALSGNVQAWAIGGLEQPLVAFLLSWGIACQVWFIQRGRRSAQRLMLTCFGLLCITRPDGVLFALAVCAVPLRTARDWRVGLRSGAILTAVCAVVLASKVAFSWVYYGDVVPNTAYIKVAPTWTRFQSGLSYLYDYAAANRVLFLWLLANLIAVVVTPSRRLRSSFHYLWPSFLVWGCYVAFVGGDIFPAFRHGVPLTALLSLAFVAVGAPSFRRALWRAAWFLGTAGALLLHHQIQVAHPENIRASTERWEWPCADFASNLKEAFSADQPLIAVQAAGCMAYFSELPAVDLYGLSDKQIAQNRPPNLGEGYLGHEFGATLADAEYLWQRRPDLWILHIGTRGLPFFHRFSDQPVGRALVETYRLVRVWSDAGENWFWLNTHSDLLRPRKIGSRYTVPALALTPTSRGQFATVQLKGKRVAYSLVDGARFGPIRLGVAGMVRPAVHTTAGDAEIRCTNVGPTARPARADQLFGDEPLECEIHPKRRDRDVQVQSVFLVPIEDVLTISE